MPDFNPEFAFAIGNGRLPGWNSLFQIGNANSKLETVLQIGMPDFNPEFAIPIGNCRLPDWNSCFQF